MNMLIKRRQLIMATLVVALGAAVFVNWYFTRDADDLSTKGTTGADYVQNIGEAQYVNANGTTEKSDWFAKAKLERQKSHDEAFEKLQSVLDGIPVDSSSAEEVAQKIDALSALIKQETDLEMLISAKLTGECVVILDGTKARVIVGKEYMNENAVLQITDIITSGTEIAAGDIQIVEA